MEYPGGGSDDTGVQESNKMPTRLNFCTRDLAESKTYTKSPDESKAIPAGYFVYVVDTGNRRVQKLNLSGVPLAVV